VVMVLGKMVGREGLEFGVLVGSGGGDWGWGEFGIVGFKGFEELEGEFKV